MVDSVSGFCTDLLGVATAFLATQMHVCLKPCRLDGLKEPIGSISYASIQKRKWKHPSRVKTLSQWRDVWDPLISIGELYGPVR